MGKTPEEQLNAIRKLEGNKSCVNCGSYNKFGHPNVCEPFKTFTCSQCKSAHQSFSMRVKHYSMSNWTADEVEALKEENGGGNINARRVWFGRWDENLMRRPTEKDNLEYFKSFIDKVYNQRAFYDHNGHKASSPLTLSQQNSVKKSTERSIAPPPIENLLPCDAFSSEARPAAIDFNAFTEPIASKSHTQGNDWSAFTSSVEPSEAFGDFFAATTSSTSSVNPPFPSFDPVVRPTNTPQNPARNFDPFSDPFSQQAPINLTQSGSQSSSGYNAFGAFASHNGNGLNGMGVNRTAGGQNMTNTMNPSNMAMRQPNSLGMSTGCTGNNISNYFDPFKTQQMSSGRGPANTKIDPFAGLGLPI
uniref:Uncharacterized protein AlNc14C188G8374 n=1 Tax=Albugo laibachii Nc14 TaxID=890382 RepID=F0WFM2_9STRA|nr:conserved hypothetical protein [Albugo laibachii Nc14]CCA23283.1 conserved hypothetical protein [Albugo laibachii Nc14]|eukprot:CCA23283.1 conserved hypothetical protein [Albugo laibachii Nc14]